MNEAELITRSSCLLNRGAGTEADTSYFQDKKHDNLVKEFQQFLELNGDFLGSPQFEFTQSLNDGGTDLILTTPIGKIGFQIKSHFDVTEDAFAQKVKAQLADSNAHGLIKWYLLVCCPLEVPGKTINDKPVQFGPKIRHLLNELSKYKSSYAAAYSPLNCIRYFRSTERVDPIELRQQFHQWHYAPDDREALIREVSQPRASNSLEQIVDLAALDTPQLPKTLSSFVKKLDWSPEEDQLETTRKEICDFITRLSNLPPRSRQLLAIIVQRAHDRTTGRETLSVTELRNATGIEYNELVQQVEILEEHGFVLGEDNSIFLQSLPSGWNFWNDLRGFCIKSNLQLFNLIVELRFNLLD